MPDAVLIFHAEKGRAFRGEAGGFEPLELYGEPCFALTGLRLKEIVEELVAALGLPDRFPDLHLDLVLGDLDADRQRELEPLPAFLHERGCFRWQLLRLHDLFLGEAFEIESDSDCRRLLALLGAGRERTRLKEERLKGEIHALEREKADLEATLSAFNRPTTEELVRFLPLFFPHVWSDLAPEELVYYTEKPEIPDLPSPFPEPTPENLLWLQREFSRRAILEVCRHLADRLRPRPQVRSLLEGER